MRERLGQSPIPVGIGLMVAGFFAIAAGWYGAARTDFVEGQFPYLLSGGLLGLGLVGAGLTVILIEVIRQATAEISERLSGLTDLVTTSTARPTSDLDPGPATTAVDEPAAEGGERSFVAGRSTFHRPDCRIVRNRDLPRLSPTEAASGPLAPCRVCRPDQPR